MLIKTVEYKDFLNNPRKKTLYFNITETQAKVMYMNEAYVTVDDKDPSNSKIYDGLSARIQETVENGSGKELLEMFEWLLRASYGVILDDGETFSQSDELYEAWKQTASYDAFYGQITSDSKAATEFFNGVWPKSMRSDDTESVDDPEFKRHREELAARQNPTL